MEQEKTELYEALLKAKQEFPPIHRTASNPFFKSKYAPLPDILTLIEPVLHKHGLMLVGSNYRDELGVTFRLSLVHAKSGKSIECHYPLHPVKDDPQGFGSANTYGQRYATCSLLMLAPDFDDDGERAMGRGDKPEPKGAKPPKMEAKAGDSVNPKEMFEIALMDASIPAERRAKGQEWYDKNGSTANAAMFAKAIHALRGE